MYTFWCVSFMHPCHLLCSRVSMNVTIIQRILVWWWSLFLFPVSFHPTCHFDVKQCTYVVSSFSSSYPSKSLSLFLAFLQLHRGVSLHAHHLGLPCSGLRLSCHPDNVLCKLKPLHCVLFWWSCESSLLITRVLHHCLLWRIIHLQLSCGSRNLSDTLQTLVEIASYSIGGIAVLYFVMGILGLKSYIRSKET